MTFSVSGVSGDSAFHWDHAQKKTKKNEYFVEIFLKSSERRFSSKLKFFGTPPVNNVECEIQPKLFAD